MTHRIFYNAMSNLKIKAFLRKWPGPDSPDNQHTVNFWFNYPGALVSTLGVPPTEQELLDYLTRFLIHKNAPIVLLEVHIVKEQKIQEVYGGYYVYISCSMIGDMHAIGEFLMYHTAALGLTIDGRLITFEEE
jgi:hypothetical protein